MDAPSVVEDQQVQPDAVAGLEADEKTAKQPMDLEQQMHSRISTLKTRLHSPLWTTRRVVPDEAQVDSDSSEGGVLGEELVQVVEVQAVALALVGTDATSLVNMVEEVAQLEPGTEGDGKTGKRLRAYERARS